MGQYYVVVNVSKRQFIHPDRFGDGMKLAELLSGGLTLAALAVLLADGNGRGGGDLRSDDPLVGSWAGDRIVLAGDYADPNGHGVATSSPAHPSRNLHQVALAEWEDISERVFLAMMDDESMRERIEEVLGDGIDSDKARFRRLNALWQAKRGATEGGTPTKIRGRALWRVR